MNKSNTPIASDPSAPHVRRTTKLRLSLFSLVCSIAFAARSPVAADVPPEVNIAANEGLPAFLAQVPSTSKQLYGFPKDEDMSKACLGTPVLLQAIKPSALSSNQVGDTVSSVAAETSMWFFPVLMGAEVKAMLVVDRLNNEWKAVSLGYAPLAREWNQVLNQWPASKGFHPRLVASFQAGQFYFTVPEAGDGNLTPLLSPRDAGPPAKPLSYGSQQFSHRYSTLGNCSAEVSKLRAVLRRADLQPGRQP